MTTQEQRNIIASEAGYADAMAMPAEEIAAPPDAEDDQWCDVCEFYGGVGCFATESDPCPVGDA